MSDEARAYVKAHSPFKGTTWWFHFVMGDLANWQHDYEIYVSDKRLAEEWPITRSAATRARAELIEGGYLAPLSDQTAPGTPRRYRFEFQGAEEMRKGNAPHSEARLTRGAPHHEARTRLTTKRERASNPEPHLLPTEEGTEGELKKPRETESEPLDPERGWPQFWSIFPRRNGRKLTKAAAKAAWAKLTLPERRDAYRAAQAYAIACDNGEQIAKDAVRFLRRDVWEEWLEPAIPSANGNGHRPAGVNGDRQASARQNIAERIREELSQ